MLRQAIMAEARAWIGTPYRHQGATKGVGCDCLGLVRGVYRAVLGREPEQPGPYAPDWAESGGRDLLLDAAGRHCRTRPAGSMLAGDLIVFRWRPELPAKHAGILTGPESFVHAYSGSAVVESALVPHWRRKIAGVFAFAHAT
ncbi:MAG: NlpC/P60 family protein [Rhizobiaceae bacterium]